MKRLTGFLLAGIFAAYAAVLPVPPDRPGPDFVGPEPPAVSASASGSVWYCPWLDSGDIRDSAFLLASVPPSESRITMPSPIPNEPPIEETILISGPGSRVLNVADVVRFGAAPGFVEFDDGPAAAAATVMSQTSLAGDRCVRSVPKIWYLAGGTTRDGRDLVVRLFNPFAELAKVTVGGVSEFGPEPLPELGTVIDVPGRAWIDLDLAPIVPFLDDLVLIIGTEEGLVIPALSIAATGGDAATWPGTGLSTSWEFPMVQTDDLVPELVVANPGSEPVTVDVDAFELLRSDFLVVSAEVPPGAPLRLALPDNDGQPYGIRVTANGPIAAVVVAESPVDPLEPDQAVPDPDAELEPVVLRVAGTVGVETSSTGWLLPGAGAVSGAISTIWMMNSGEEPATVTLKPLGVRDLSAEKVAVPAGRVVGFEIPDYSAIAGYLLESTAPITAAWVGSDPGGTAFVAGIGIDA
jgi:hypothetical protein